METEPDERRRSDRAERLALAERADAARHVGLFIYYVLPEGVERVDIRLVACHGGYVGHAGIHIGGAYRMSLCKGLPTRPVTTSGLRLELRLQPDKSAGISEWKVN